MTRNLDSQEKELISRSILEARLIREGFEVARPARDKGIDLLVFKDEAGCRFRAVPIQIKSAIAKSFFVSKRLSGRGLVMAYIWHVLSDAPEIYLIPHDKALRLHPTKFHKTPIWKKKGRWAETSPGDARIKSLQPYKDNFSLLNRMVK